MITYTVKEIVINNYSEGKSTEKREAIIVKYENDKRDIWFPSPLTEYVYHYHKNASINTKLKSARIVCQFINFLNNQVRLNQDDCFECLKEQGIKALNYNHLAKFINYLSNNIDTINSYETVKDKEATLLKFYNFLYQRRITGEDAKINRKIVEDTNRWKNSEKRGHYVFVSPFEENCFPIHYPNKDRVQKKILKDMDDDVWNLFIEYAEKTYPNIALGIAFQCMGGLRMGEVVNLKIDSVKLFRNYKHIRIDIEDRQNELFRDRNIDVKKSQVKHQRLNQPVFDFNGRLFELWDKHISWLNSNEKIINKMALFVDSNGKAMSGDSYEKYFYRLKKDFIELLESNGNAALAKFLSEYSWGSHIGRHIFTNYLIKTGIINNMDGKPQAEYLRILRGDRSPYSAGDYIDNKAIIEVVINKINMISNRTNIDK
jgi:hypothetical protein